MAIAKISRTIIYSLIFNDKSVTNSQVNASNEKIYEFMKRITKLMVVAILSMGVSFITSCDIVVSKRNAEKSAVTQNSSIKVQDFNEIKVSNAAEVKYVAGGGAPLVVVTADEAILDNIVVKVVDHKLHLGLKGLVSYNTLKFEVYGTPMIEEIDVMGAASVEVIGALNPRNLDVECSGASKVNINGVSCAELKIDCMGASYVKIEKIDCDELDVDCSGASSVFLDGRCQTAKYKANGASTIKVSSLNAIKIEKAESNGASNIMCK